MSDNGPTAPAGWYPHPDGTAQRYWDGSQWLTMPEPADTPPEVDDEPWDGDTSDPEYQAELAKARALDRPRRDSGFAGRAAGWALMGISIIVLVGGFVDQNSTNGKIERLNEEAMRIGAYGLMITGDAPYPVGYAMVGGFLLLLGAIVVIGNRRRT